MKPSPCDFTTCPAWVATLRADDGVVGLEHLVPAGIAELDGPLGGAFDVGEHDGDGAEIRWCDRRPLGIDHGGDEIDRGLAQGVGGAGTGRDAGGPEIDGQLDGGLAGGDDHAGPQDDGGVELAAVDRGARWWSRGR